MYTLHHTHNEFLCEFPKKSFENITFKATVKGMRYFAKSTFSKSLVYKKDFGLI